MYSYMHIKYIVDCSCVNLMYTTLTPKIKGKGMHIYRKRRKFRGVKISWFLNYGLLVKFRGFRGSRLIHQ